MDRLAGVVVVVPDAGRAVRVGAGDVAVEVVRGGVVEDLPKVGCGVEDLGEGDVGVGGLEGVHLADELVVVRVEVADEGREVRGAVRVEGGGFVECCFLGGPGELVLCGERERKRRVRRRGGGKNKGHGHTRNSIDDKVPNTIVVQVLHQTKVLGHDLVDGTGGVLGRLPEALADVIDADPHGDQQIVGGPLGVRRGRDEVVLKLGDLGDDVGGDARVDDGVGHISAVVGEIIGEHRRGVVLAGD